MLRRWSRVLGRRGVNLIGLILLILTMVGIGAGLMNLSQQAGRSGHWFHHSQLAHDLADAGLKQCFYLLVQGNSLNVNPNLPLAAELQQIVQNINTSTPGELTLFSTAQSSTPPPALATMLAKLSDYKPELEVKVSIAQPEPLWSGLLDGIPAEPNEKKGGVSIVAHATLRAPAGIKVERTIVLEKAYKVINLVPPLLGRFGLFVLNGPANADEPNTVPMKHDRTTAGPMQGSADFSGAERPLTLESTFAGPIVAQGTNNLDRGRFVGSIPQGSKFLDQQGWVYLGGGTWELKLAHGWGEGGESPLLPGYRPPLSSGFGANTQQFNTDFENSCSTRFSCAVQMSQPLPAPPDGGLFTWWHGLADNYEIISLDNLSKVQTASGAREPLVDFGPGKTSFLRLFGDPALCSPTLVFGDVRRVVMQRAEIVCYTGPACNMPNARIATRLWKFDQFNNLEKGLVTDSFKTQTAYEQFGTMMRKDLPFAASLNTVLGAAGNGNYIASGLLGLLNTGGANRTFDADYFDKLGTLDSTKDMDQQVLNALGNATFAAPKLYTGELKDGFKAFWAAIQKKTTYEMTKNAFDTKVLVNGQGGGKELKVPGVILVKSGLTLPAITKVPEGGIVVATDAIQINGNITVGPPATGATVPLPQPLTLVALKGDITIAPSVSQVEAYLVALDGTVKIGSTSGITITGGIAAKKLDPANAAGPGKRKLKHHEAIDPKGRNATVTKVFYGGEDRLMVSGTTP